MNLHLTSGNIIALVFILISLVSLSYVAFATLNYARYFPATSDLYANVSQVSVRRDSLSGNTTVQTGIVVGNPSDYSGFSLYSEQVSLFFFSPEHNDSIFQDHPVSMLQTGLRTLGPRSTINEDLSTKLTPDQSSSFASFNQTYPGQILARVRLHVQISSFLDPVTGRVTFEKLVDISPS